MLLCCFREPKNKKKRDDDDGEDSVAVRAPPPPPQNGAGKRCGVGQRVSLAHSVTAVDSGGGGLGSRRSSTSSGCRAPPLRDGAARREKERAPLMKDEKRMMKQRSHERRTSTSSSGGGVGHLPYIDQSPAKEEAQREPPVSGRRKGRLQNIFGGRDSNFKIENKWLCVSSAPVLNQNRNPHSLRLTLMSTASSVSSLWHLCLRRTV